MLLRERAFAHVLEVAIPPLLALGALGCTVLYPFVELGPDAGESLDAGPILDASNDAADAEPRCLEGSRRCRDGHLQTCEGGGWGQDQECENGCASSDDTRCALLRPSTVDLPFTTPADNETTLFDITWDTDQCGAFGGVPARPIDGEQPEVCVLQVGTLVVPDGVVVTVRGSRALVILASGAVSILGRLDASATGTVPGAGGSVGGDTGEGLQNGAGPTGGGAGEFAAAGSTGGAGGGGACGAGGPGGAATGVLAPPPGPDPAHQNQDNPTDIWVVGGGGGGAGAGLNGERSRGGAGGGAIQISSLVEIEVRERGWIGAAGGGGAGTCIGIAMASQCSGAGGGGGGTIWLEAPRVQIVEGGTLNAGGGGGGGGGNEVSEAGEAGADGRASVDRARGGPSPAPSGDGGRGGGEQSIDGEGGSAGDVAGNGGGGGGGAGCIVLLSADGTIVGELNPDVVVGGQPRFD